MPTIQHILETALYVDDVDRSERFYHDLFGFRTVVTDADRLRALRVSDGQILLLFAKGKSTKGADTPFGHIPGHDGAGRLHLALAIASEDVEPWRQQLAEKNIEIISFLGWVNGGQSIYIRDPDGHLIELGTSAIWPP